MNSPKALDSTASDLRWAVDELIDFMESCLGRNPRDLKLHGQRISDSLANAVEWLRRDSSRSDKVSLESIAVSVAVPAMNEIVTHANRRLRRNRELVPLENLRAQDARCLMWLARRPGNNLTEKLTKDRRLLGVVRELSFDVLENRVAYETARLLSRLLPSDPTTWKDADFRKARFACSEFLGMAESFGIRGLSHAPRPNNALLRDKKYRRIWLAYRWLLARDEFRETIGEQVRRSLAEALMLVMGALPETLDFQLADAALPCMARPSTLASWLRNSQMQWFRFSPGSLDLLEVSLIGNTHSPEIVVRWKSFKGRQHNLEDATAREMLLKPVFKDSRIEVSICDHGQAHHLTFCEENGGLRHMARILHHHVAAWFEAYPAGDNVVNTSGPTGRKTLRFTATQLECGEINVDCFCGILRSQSDTEDVVLSGGGARNRRILGMGGVGGPGWITPGRLSRALSRPGVTGSAFRELVERAGHNRNDHPFEAIAVPAGLPFGFESAVRAGLGANGGDCWLIPQPISSVLAATWGHDSKIHPELEDFYSSIDFDGERVDASLVRWTNIQDPMGNKSLGWLHFREIRDARQLGPRAIELIYQVLLLAMADAGVPNGRRRQACIEALYQVKISQLWGLLEDHPSCVEVWSLLNADEPVFCEVRSEHVQRCVTGWLETSVIPWLSEREAISSSRGGYAKKFLFNGAIFRIPWIRERFANWCEDMGTSKPTFLYEDQVAQGLVIFLKRQAAGEATWSEHLPVLEILGRNSQSQPQWLRMFDEDASVSPGGRILMGPSFSFVTDQRVFSVPMRCDGERGGPL